MAEGLRVGGGEVLMKVTMPGILEYTLVSVPTSFPI